ncbi:DNA glycosylase AlkZ-like family protein [Nocardioides sp.]|uniref:DNA glycosylase AlkZ-like family protein n=1 Tax=Nocardioides sp. TaxID=35761 RepID=UPI003528F0F2
MPVELTREQARRIAVRAQLLTQDRPPDVAEVARRLTVLQADFTAYVAPHAHLLLWSRLGSDYDRGELDAALEDRSLVELRSMIRPGEDISLFRARMRAWPGPEPLRDWQREIADWVEANDLCRREILQHLQSEGPQPARALPDSTAVPWRSSGWTNAKNVQRLLDFLEQRGEVAVSHREGRERIWDIAERVYPDDSAVPVDEADAVLARRRLAALGLARPKVAEVPGEPFDVGEIGEEAVVDGVRGRWRVDPDLLERELAGSSFDGRVALLSPLDRLVFDRKRATELFDFDYQLEMYKPAAKRRWGYFALPILDGDRLVGKLDAEADPAGGVLRVYAVHEDEPWPAARRRAVDAEIAGLATWLSLAVTHEEH